MHCDKIMVALLDEIDSAERVFKCSFAVKTQLGALEASLQQSTLEDSRDRDLSRLIKLIKLRFRSYQFNNQNQQNGRQFTQFYVYSGKIKSKK